jgi:sterol desaturase/sphingolipid hydroxylase (fatty acid hydroxylase superfamily)
MVYSFVYWTHAAIEALGVFAAVLPFEIGRYVLGAGAVYLCVNVLLAAPLAARKIRPKTPPISQMAREFWASMRTAAIFSLFGVVSIAGTRAGVLHAYDDPSEFGWAWFAASVAVLIVLHDAWFYWTHRLIHRPRLFSKVHGFHHKSKYPTPFTAYSFDVAEAGINAAFLPLMLLIFPVSQLAIFIFLAHMIVRNAIGHCGYELFPARRDGRPLFGFVTTVTHHDLHHAQAGWNYGLYFTWWDRLMGTEHPLYAEKFAAAVGRPLRGSAVAALRAPA